MRLGIPRLRHPDGNEWGTVAGAAPVLRLAVLGDSSAAGVGATTQEEALAGQVARAVAGLTGREVSWRVAARSGATVRRIRDELVDRLTDPCTQWRPDLVLVAAGANDATRLRRPRAFRRDVDELIAAIRARLGEPVPVLLAGLPPMHRFPALPAPLRLVFGVRARQLDRQLARLARHDAHRAGPVFHLPVGQLPVEMAGFFAADRFHPGPIGYRRWGRLLAVQIASLVEGRQPEAPAAGW
jgi:lysophospholipase L1-like esterase